MREYQVKYKGKTYRVVGHEPTEYISSYLNKGTFYEEPLLSYLHRKYSPECVVDIGANVGNHSLFFKKVMGAKEVICFEPNKENYEVLVEGSKLIKYHNVALSDQPGRADSHSSPGNMGASHCTPNPTGAVEVQTLDSYDLSPQLIKIDAENMEVQVVRGAAETIRRSKPVLIVEHHDLQHLYDFVRTLNQIGVPYLVKPFVKQSWEVFEYIPQLVA